MGPWGTINMSTFRELEKTGDIVTIWRLKMFRPCQHWVDSLWENSKANGSHWTGAQQNWTNWDQTRGHSVWLPSTASLMDDKQLLCICPVLDWDATSSWNPYYVWFWVYPCTVQYTSHQPHVASEHMKCGQCNWGASFEISLNFK